MNNVQTDSANQQRAQPLDNVYMGLTALVGYVRVNICNCLNKISNLVALVTDKIRTSLPLFVGS